MNHKCEKFEEFLLQSRGQSISKERSAAWKKHLSKCRECQMQWKAHQHLTHNLGSLPTPHLSEDFMNRIRNKAYQPPSVKAPHGWARFILRPYWITTIFVSFYLMFRIKWSLPSIKNAWFIYLLLAICFAGPFIIIRRSKISLLDFMLKLWG